MKLWKRAVGVLKDKNSIYLAGLSRRTSYRNPHLEAIVIKATSHDDSSVDYKNFQRVYQWARTSPIYMKPLIWALSTRMDKTRSWIVALKGLMLIHGVFCCKIPAVQRIGRLPFDLSSFTDGHSTRAWGFNAFVRAYFAYLDKRSTFVSSEMLRPLASAEAPLSEELQRLVTWQSLFDLLLQVKPQTENMIKVGLIFEAMICIVTEVFEVYSRICRGIARALLRVYDSPGKKIEEARLALGILQKATAQGDELSLFFELCSAMGVLHASCCPTIERIPEEDVRDLERIINGVSKPENVVLGSDLKEHQDEKAIVVIRQLSEDDHGLTKKSRESTKELKTIVTDRWEVFDEECEEKGVSNNIRVNNWVEDHNLIGVSSNYVMPPQLASKFLPDLISF